MINGCSQQYNDGYNAGYRDANYGTKYDNYRAMFNTDDYSDGYNEGYYARLAEDKVEENS